MRDMRPTLWGRTGGPWLVSRWLAPVVGCLLACACVQDVTLNGKRCDERHSCIPGYLCVEGKCVVGSSIPDAGDRPDADGGPTPDAGDEDAGPDPRDGGPPPDAGDEDAGVEVDAGPQCTPAVDGIERCGNAIDDDCDGATDEACDGCTDFTDDAAFPGALWSVCTAPLDWFSARDQCASRNLDLAVLSDALFADAVLASGGAVEAWIGLLDDLQEGQWTWVDDTQARFEAFDPGQPNGNEAENCVRLSLVGWRDAPCDDPRAFVCARPPAPTIHECGPPNRDDDGDGAICRDDCNDDDPSMAPGLDEDCFDRKDNDCDGVIDESCAACEFALSGNLVCGRPGSADEARARCDDVGMQLGKVETQELQDAVEAIIAGHGYNRCWIGLNDRSVPFELLWDDGSSLDPNVFVLFEPGQPNDDDTNAQPCFNLRDDTGPIDPAIIEALDGGVPPDPGPDGVYGWGDSGCDQRFDAYLCTLR